MTRPDIVKFFRDPRFLNFPLSPAQAAALKTFYGRSLIPAERRFMQKCLKGVYRPGKEYSEGALICGRRSGKSRLAAGIAIFEALFGGHQKFLAPGEVGTIPVVSASMRQTSVVKGYVSAMLKGSPLLKRHILNETADSVELSNGMTILCLPCSSKSIRGFSFPCVICDEIAYWPLEGFHNADVDVLDAIRPAMATFEKPKLILLSTPWLRRGELWELYKKPRGALVWQAATKLMNPTVSAAFLRRMKERDELAYKREFEARFTSAIAAMFDPEHVERAMSQGYLELEPLPGVRYFGSIDPAFTSDSFAVTIAHLQGGRIIVDLVREWKPPVDLGRVTGELAELCGRYGLRFLWSDQYAAEPLKQVFAAGGVRIKTEVFTAQFKLRAFGGLRHLLAIGGIELPDHKELRRQLVSCEERRLPGGGVRIGAPSLRGEHDDLADALALLAEKITPLAARPVRRGPVRVGEACRGRGRQGQSRADYWLEQFRSMPIKSVGKVVSLEEVKKQVNN
ncbi:MAG: hypothetical protein JRJ78_14725 [Deltaproteobacteria bacterium]|nr:hypothetical protein [Deltaproteobacteria bacterium]